MTLEQITLIRGLDRLINDYHRPHWYRNEEYRIHFTDRLEMCMCQVTVFNLNTKKTQTHILSYSAITDIKFVQDLIGKIITNIWIAKYTPVKCKLTVTTSELIGELLC